VTKHIITIGFVELSRLNFVRDKSVLFAASSVKPSYSKQRLLNKEKSAFSRIPRTAFVGYFYSVIAFLCGTTTWQRLCLV